MNDLSPEAARLEEARIRTAYGKRNFDTRYSMFNPGHLFMIQDRERKVLAVLDRYGFAPMDKMKILEIGCGTGHWLREFIKWGAKPWNITGVELLSNRVALAREVCPEKVNVYCGSAAKLTFPSATFDLVLQSTVFTSVLDADMKFHMASEMIRVTKVNGLIL